MRIASRSKPALSNERLYVIAIAYAKRRGRDEHMARDFASYEWETKRQYDLASRVFFMWQSYSKFIRRAISRHIDGEVIGVPSGEEHRVSTQFERSPIYELARFQEHLKGLSKRMKRIAIMYYVWGFDCVDIAESYGVSVVSVQKEIRGIWERLK